MKVLNSIEIKNINNVLLVSSQVIARELNKDHDKICSKIKNILNVNEISQNSATSFEAIKNTYKDSMNRIQNEYLLTKDGFILLVMNYTGYNDFKRAYIKKFNQMEQQLKIKQPSLTNIQQKALSKLKEATVKDVCQYLASNYFVNVGNISNSLRELESNYINEYLLKK